MGLGVTYLYAVHVYASLNVLLKKFLANCEFSSEKMFSWIVFLLISMCMCIDAEAKDVSRCVPAGINITFDLTCGSEEQITGISAFIGVPTSNCSVNKDVRDCPFYSTTVHSGVQYCNGKQNCKVHINATPVVCRNNITQNVSVEILHNCSEQPSLNETDTNASTMTTTSPSPDTTVTTMLTTAKQLLAAGTTATGDVSSTDTTKAWIKVSTRDTSTNHPSTSGTSRLATHTSATTAVVISRVTTDLSPTASLSTNDYTPDTPVTTSTASATDSNTNSTRTGPLEENSGSGSRVIIITLSVIIAVLLVVVGTVIICWCRKKRQYAATPHRSSGRQHISEIRHSGAENKYEPNPIAIIDASVTNPASRDERIKVESERNEYWEIDIPHDDPGRQEYNTSPGNVNESVSVQKDESGYSHINLKVGDPVRIKAPRCDDVDGATSELDGNVYEGNTGLRSPITVICIDNDKRTKNVDYEEWTHSVHFRQNDNYKHIRLPMHDLEIDCSDNNTE